MGKSRHQHRPLLSFCLAVLLSGCGQETSPPMATAAAPPAAVPSVPAGPAGPAGTQRSSLAELWRVRLDPDDEDEDAYRLVVDQLQGSEPPKAFGNPDEATIRRAVQLIVSGAKDFLVLEVEGEVGEEHMQAVRNEDGSFDLEVAVSDELAKRIILFGTERPVTEAQAIEALIEYRQNGDGWLAFSTWVRRDNG